MLDAKLPPPSPAVDAAIIISQKGVSGRCTSVISAERRNEQQERAHHRPVAPAEARHRERIGEAHEGADEAGHDTSANS